MTDLSTSPGVAPGAARPARSRDAGLYRAVWRWHFYAGLLVLPILALIAATGALYLFKDEINDLLYSDLRLVAPQASETLPPSRLVAAALEAHPGTLKAYAPPAAPDRAAQAKITGEDGLTDVVYLNPWTAEVLGEGWDGGFAGSTFMWTVRKLHSLEYAGWLGNRLVEAVAGWAILLVITGFYLWWPRGRGFGVFSLKARRGRPFWRDLHAVTGAYAGLAIAFLALTGLPWSGVWGAKFYDWSYAAGLGMPDGYWSNYPTSTVPVGEALDHAPWILERQPMPLSTTAEGVPAGLDQVVATVRDLGLAPGWALTMPRGAEGVFTASVYPDDASAERIVHLDQYSGKVLYDMGFSDLGALGRLAEWSISVHMGQQFGLANQIVLLLVCLGVVAMAVAAGVMWWKRRPAGGLGAPRPPQDWRAPRVILVLAVLAGLVFPLVGLTLLIMLAIDLILPRALRRRLG